MVRSITEIRQWKKQSQPDLPLLGRYPPDMTMRCHVGCDFKNLFEQLSFSHTFSPTFSHTFSLFHFSSFVFPFIFGNNLGGKKTELPPSPAKGAMRWGGEAERV